MNVALYEQAAAFWRQAGSTAEALRYLGAVLEDAAGATEDDVQAEDWEGDAGSVLTLAKEVRT